MNGTGASGRLRSPMNPATPAEWTRAAGALLGTMRTRVPLVHCLTNHVVTNFTANVLLAAGAAPAMIHDPEESSIFAGVASALLVNVGTIEREQAEAMRLSILGKDGKARDDKPLGVVDAYVKENTTELVDPLGAEKRVAELKEKKEKLLAELETQIKVSNATTLIEF